MLKMVMTLVVMKVKVISDSLHFFLSHDHLRCNDRDGDDSDDVVEDDVEDGDDTGDDESESD